MEFPRTPHTKNESLEAPHTKNRIPRPPYKKRDFREPTYIKNAFTIPQHTKMEFSRPQHIQKNDIFDPLHATFLSSYKIIKISPQNTKPAKFDHHTKIEKNWLPYTKMAELGPMPLIDNIWTPWTTFEPHIKNGQNLTTHTKSFYPYRNLYPTYQEMAFLRPSYIH